MVNRLPDNLDFLLEKEWVENFLNENSAKIFQKTYKISVKRIERSKSFAPEVFNMIYDLSLDGQPLTIRAASSTIIEKETPFKVMKFLYDHGFSDGDFLVPEPLSYFPELNLHLYKDAPGFMMKDFISEPKEAFAEKVAGAAKALKRIHQVGLPDFALEPTKWDINQEKILQYAPKLEFCLKRLLDQNLEKAQKNKTSFCHGDYQTKNIVLGEKLCIIDFGSSTIAEKELDIASFITQLEIMLKRYSDISEFDYLRQIFFDYYGEYDSETYKTYEFLYRLVIMNALTVIYEQDPNAVKEEILSAIEFWQERIIENYA